MELLSKEKVDKEEEHDVYTEEVIAEVKVSVVVAVSEAKIKLAEDVANAESWNLDGLCEALAKLIGKPVSTNQDPKGK